MYQSSYVGNEQLDLLDIVDFDEDTCVEKELKQIFHQPYACVGHLLIAHRYTYVLHLDGNGIESGGTFAAGLTDRSVMVYSVDQFSLLQKIQCQSLDIIGLKFSSVNPRLLFVGTKDKITLWDLRTKVDQPANIFIDHTIADNPKRLKPLTAFDVSLDDQVLCGGTEQRGENTFLLFWDVRQAQLEGGYWDSHGGDITQVRFHPNERDTLAVSSIEGLLNIFDVGEGSEDDALQMSLNTQDISIDKMMWCSYAGNQRHLCCLTHRETVQFWNVKDALPLFNCSREDITYTMQRKLVTNCYLVNCHSIPDSEKILLVCGSSARPKSCLRVLSFDSGKLSPFATLCSDRSNQIVRCSHFLPQSHFFITGGEGGILNLWRPYISGDPPPPVIAFSEPEAFFHTANFHLSANDPYRPVMPVHSTYKIESDLKQRFQIRSQPY